MHCGNLCRDTGMALYQNRESKMKNAVIYIHGKGGNASESEHYKPLFPDYDVIGLDYKTFTPWEACTRSGRKQSLRVSSFDRGSVVYRFSNDEEYCASWFFSSKLVT